LLFPAKKFRQKCYITEKTIVVPRPLPLSDQSELEAKYLGYSIEVSSAVSYGHKDFAVVSDPFLPFEEACKRRDFTINSILIDVLSGDVIDPFDGVSDIKKGMIRATNPKAFMEDSLRVYRAVQFAARFQFSIDETTKHLCRRVDLSFLPKERVYGELEKLLMKSPKPSVGLSYMKELGMLRYHSLLESLVDCPQEPTHHPEGSVWNHTLMVVDEAAKRKHESKNPVSFMWAALLHDIGKPVTTEKNDQGKITSYGHDKAGKELAVEYLKTLTDNKKLLEEGFGIINIYYKDRVIGNSVIWVNEPYNCLVLDNIEIHPNYTRFNEVTKKLFKKTVLSLLFQYQLDFAVQGRNYNDLKLYADNEKHIMFEAMEPVMVEQEHFYSDARYVYPLAYGMSSEEAFSRIQLINQRIKKERIKKQQTISSQETGWPELEELAF
jgi:putative nucleotidyltransferase with HDIG domain